jgi:Sporulation and spore germination
MNQRARLLLTVGGVLLTAALAWFLFVGVERWRQRPTQAPAEETAGAPPAATESAPPAAPHIKAHLFYVSNDGLRLKPEEREVLFGEGTAAQARRIIEAQLEPPAAPAVSAIPAGTTLKELFISERGEAYVNLSSEIASNHPGGSIDEILTVYTIVNALTDNLPAIVAVQILIDGHEVDTLAGHVDLRRPLRKNLEWVEAPKAAPAN